MATTSQTSTIVLTQGKPPGRLQTVDTYLAQQQVNLNQFVARLNQLLTAMQKAITEIQAASTGIIIGEPNGTRWTVGVDDTDRANPITKLKPVP